MLNSPTTQVGTKWIRSNWTASNPSGLIADNLFIQIKK
ncbi:hypothetical protein SynROS8604_00932 [Synechococcus sp. ROS8604]|nr:hypothetical protein SynROS8604_00932 [Synechococcus sp. ROS8604]